MISGFNRLTRLLNSCATCGSKGKRSRIRCTSTPEAFAASINWLDPAPGSRAPLSARTNTAMEVAMTGCASRLLDTRQNSSRFLAGPETLVPSTIANTRIIPFDEESSTALLVDESTIDRKSVVEGKRVHL